MKKNRIIIPALGLIALGTAASITGTVAWFTANNSVKITGMTFSTKAGNNILVANDQASAFTDAVFAESLNQEVSARLEPVSTINGVNFFYTTLSNDDGSATANSEFYTYNETEALSNTYAKKTAYDERLNEKFVGGSITDANVVYGYVDYTFYLKATFTDVNQYILMNECTLKYNGGAVGTETAWRVGVFAKEVTKTGDNIAVYSTAMSTSENKTLLAMSGATHFEAGKAISAVASEGTKSPTRSAVTYGTWAASHIDKSAAAGVKYYKAVVRVWLEGEDNTCYVDKFKTLTANYSLSVGFTIDTVTTSAVTVIG